MAVQILDPSELGSLVGYQATSGTVSVQSSVVNGSAFALRSNPATTAVGYAESRNFANTGALTGTAGVATGWFSFDFRYATKPGAGSEPIAAVRNFNSQTKCTLRITSAGVLALYDTATALVATGATVLNADTWYRIDIKAGTESGALASDAAYEVRVGGVSEFSGSNGDLTNSNTLGIRLGKAANVSGQSVDFFYDNYSWSDLAYADTASRVKSVKPNGAGNYSGATAGTWADVDELPPDDDTTFLAWTSNTSQHSAALESSATAGVSGTIAAVQGYGVGRDTGAAAVNHKLFLRSGGADTDSGSGFSLGTTYQFFGGKVFETDPADAAAWTTAKLDALEVGALIATTSAVEQRVTAMGVLVGFVPGSDGARRQPCFGLPGLR
jgi:hypothetical protein